MAPSLSQTAATCSRQGLQALAPGHRSRPTTPPLISVTSTVTSPGCPRIPRPQRPLATCSAPEPLRRSHRAASRAALSCVGVGHFHKGLPLAEPGGRLCCPPQPASAQAPPNPSPAGHAATRRATATLAMPLSAPRQGAPGRPGHPPCSVVMDLCEWTRWAITWSSEPCHLHDAPGHGHRYGLHRGEEGEGLKGATRTMRTKPRAGAGLPCKGCTVDTAPGRRARHSDGKPRREPSHCASAAMHT